MSVSVQAALRGQRTALSQTRASARRASLASRSVSSRASGPTADCCWRCSVLSVSVSVVQGTHSAAGAWQRKSSLAVQSWTLTGVVVAARQLLQARAADERFFVFPNARLIFPICGTPFSPYIRDLFEFSFFCRICLCSVSVSVCRRRNRLVLGSARASLRAALSQTRVQCVAARHSSSKHQRVKLAPVRCCCCALPPPCSLLRRHRRRVRPRAAHATPPARSRSRSQSCSGHPPRHGSNSDLGRAFDVRSDRFSARRELR